MDFVEFNVVRYSGYGYSDLSSQPPIKSAVNSSKPIPRLDVSSGKSCRRLSFLCFSLVPTSEALAVFNAPVFHTAASITDDDDGERNRQERRRDDGHQGERPPESGGAVFSERPDELEDAADIAHLPVALGAVLVGVVTLDAVGLHDAW